MTFIKGRSITDSIGMVYEVYKLLDHRIEGGYLCLKLDITKVFDPMEQGFC